MKTNPCLLGLIGALLSLSPPTHAATKTWDGSSGGNWNTAGNWTNNAVPVDGDDLLFPVGAASLTSTNDIADLRLKSITFNAANYTLRGSAISLTNGISATAISGNTILAFVITNGAAQTYNSAGTLAFLIFSNNIVLGANALTIAGSGDTTLRGGISGAGGLIKSGGGLLTLSGTNTYTGATSLGGSGLVNLSSGSGLGSASGGTTISNSATLQLLNSITVPEPMTLVGILDNGTGSNTITGALTMSLTNGGVLVETNSALTLSNVINGAGALTKTGPGRLTLSGNANNTYAGATTVSEGTLALNKTLGTNAVPGALIIGDDIGGANVDVVQLLNASQIPDSAAITINSSGLLDVNGKGETIGSLSGSGNVSLGSGVLTVGGDDTSKDFSGVISGAGGSLFKTGSGTQMLSGDNTYTGTTLVQDGTLLVNGSQPGSFAQVGAGGTLGGTGRVGTLLVASNAVLNPGASPGILTSGNATFNAGSTFAVELNGTNAGTGYDQLNVTGTVSLASCALDVNLGFAPDLHDTFTIINNDSTDAVTGTFTGLSNNATFIVGNTRFRINYTNGTGNDVVLTVVPFATGATKTWTGNGANALWSNATNWVVTNAPVAGDNLSFPAGAARFTNTNDFPADRIFNTLTFSGSNYVINGNVLPLNAGLTNNGPGGAGNTFNCAVRLTDHQNFASISNATLNFNGAVDTGQRILTLINDGSVLVSGVISNSGAIIKKGAGRLTLSAANTFSGSARFEAGTATLQNNAALGLTSGDTVVVPPAVLEVQNNITVPERISLSSVLRNVSGNNVLSGAMNLGLTNSTVLVETNSSLILNNVLSGVGGLVKTGPGDLTLSGNSNNTYASATVVNEGTLLLNKTSTESVTDTIPGPLFIQGTVRLLQAQQIADVAPVTVSSGGKLDLNNFLEAIGSLAGSAGSSVVLGSGLLNTGGNNGSTAFAGIISGAGGGLNKIGDGTLTLSGNNTYTGDTGAGGGTLLINGTQPNSRVFVDGGILGGTGTVGTILVLDGGTVNPGASPGTLNSSNVTFDASGVFKVELNSTASGTGYDQLNVTGSVNLGGSALQVAPGFTPVPGDSFTIINNDLAEAVTGAFAGLTNGARFSASGLPFQISYNGGDGNDVVLTRLAGAPSQLSSIAALTNGFTQIQGLGQGKLTYTLQANSNLNTTNWIAIGTAPADSSGVFLFTDTNAPLFPMRFYRALTP